MKTDEDVIKENKDSPVEKTDYYFENGNLVFTEEYHKKRGYCCESNCRHCPYGFGKEKI